MISAYRIADYVLSDGTTLSQLVGTLATDVIKVGIATGVSIAAASAVVGFGVTLAVGPILAVVVVGVALNYTLNELDKAYGITDKVIAGLDEMTNNASAMLERAKQNAQNIAFNGTNSIIDYAVASMKKAVINSAKHSLKQFLNGRPRAY